MAIFGSNKMSRLFILFVAIICCLVLVPAGFADINKLRQSIIDWNLKQHKKSLADGSYRGEEGVLRISPEVARSFGLKVPMDPGYLKAMNLFKKAEEYREDAIEAITTQKREKIKGEHAKRAGDLALLSNKAFKSAQGYIKAYRSGLDPELDERLDKERGSRLMDKLLASSLKKMSNNLRDGLGLFYNRSRGLDARVPSLTPENVKFANYVFGDFTKKASAEALKTFDLDKQRQKSGSDPAKTWQSVVGWPGSRYASLVAAMGGKQKKAGYDVDPLLFMALMKRESNFSPKAVSYVGAAGLTQIMPRTARGLGMKNVFEPPHFDQAVSLLKKERKLKQKAIGLLSQITEKNRVKFAKLARKYMRMSRDCRKERVQLFSRYKKELLDNAQDDRLDPAKAIEHGYKYFSQMMKTQKGDMSLALASYNAGPHRVKQYKGIPPFAETVSFRNSVLRYYREYLKRMVGNEK